MLAMAAPVFLGDAATFHNQTILMDVVTPDPRRQLTHIAGLTTSVCNRQCGGSVTQTCHSLLSVLYGKWSGKRKAVATTMAMRSYSGSSGGPSFV